MVRLVGEGPISAYWGNINYILYNIIYPIDTYNICMSINNYIYIYAHNYLHLPWCGFFSPKVFRLEFNFSSRISSRICFVIFVSWSVNIMGLLHMNLPQAKSCCTTIVLLHTLKTIYTMTIVVISCDKAMYSCIHWNDKKQQYITTNFPDCSQYVRTQYMLYILHIITTIWLGNSK